MIDKIRYIYKVSHGLNYKIDLNKIIRQKNYVIFNFNLSDENITKVDLDLLEDKKLILSIDDGIYIILPLGYALLLSENSYFDDNIKYYLLEQIYDAQCSQLSDRFKVGNVSNLECALGFFILLNGCTSKDNSFRFIKIDDTYRFYNVIEKSINELVFRLFYNSNTEFQQLKDHIHLRNFLGRNNKNGNLKKHTNYHSVYGDRGNGITFHWFDIENEDGSIDFEKLSIILDKLLSNNKNLITLLNVKKIALNNSLINLLPFELKKIIGEQTTRAEVLQKIISYTNIAIESYFIETNNKDKAEVIEFLKNINIKSSSSVLIIEDLYREFTDIINKYPEIGIFLIEVHYRLSKVIIKIDEDDEANIIFKSKRVYEVEEILGSDFFDILNENITTCIRYLQK